MGRRGKKRLSPKRRRNAAMRRQGLDPQLTTGVVTGQTTTQAQPNARPLPEGREGGSPVAQPADASDAIPGAPETPPVETPLFDRLEKARSDAELVRRAIRHRWQPDPRVTQAILAKAGMIALGDQTTPSVFHAMAKLQFEAERQVTSDEHHQQRMEYYERALSLRAGSKAGIPETIGGAPGGTALTVDTSGPSRISIYIPDNGRDPVADMQDLERLEKLDQ